MNAESMVGVGTDKPRDTNPTHCAVTIVLGGTVADIPDNELLRRVVQTVTRKPRRQEFAWAAVMTAFGLGSTYASQLCRRFGIDPDTGAELKTPNVRGNADPTAPRTPE